MARMVVASHWWAGMRSSSASPAQAEMSAATVRASPDWSELVARRQRPASSSSRSPAAHPSRSSSSAMAERSSSPSGPHTVIHRARSAPESESVSPRRRASSTASRLTGPAGAVSSEKVSSSDSRASSRARSGPSVAGSASRASRSSSTSRRLTSPPLSSRCP